MGRLRALPANAMIVCRIANVEEPPKNGSETSGEEGQYTFVTGCGKYAQRLIGGQDVVKQSNRGKAVILGIFAMALLLSGYAWWHQFQKSRRCREFLGTNAVQLIRLAPQVELLRLEQISGFASDSNRPQGTLRIGSETVLISQHVEITGTPGLLHARHALLQDVNYRWDASQSDCVSQWSFALRFVQDGEDVIIAFDTQCNRIGLTGTERTGPFLPELMQTFAEKSDEWEKGALAEAGR